jgi:uroporphyrinogen decarboxylase
MPPPDYRRLLTTLRHEEPDRVPIAELGFDPPIKAKLLGRPVRTVEDDVECWYRSGYDYIYLRPAYEFPHTMPGNTTTGQPKYGQTAEREEKSVPMTEDGVIATMADLDGYAWPDPGCEAYYQPLADATRCLPSGMGLISGVGGIFTRVWMLLGFERFCLALDEQPDLVAELFRRVAAIQIAILKRVIRQPGLIAVWYGDDLAYTEAFMVSPDVYRKYLFPHMEELAKIAHDARMPFMYHSDGKLCIPSNPRPWTSTKSSAATEKNWRYSATLIPTRWDWAHPNKFGRKCASASRIWHRAAVTPSAPVLASPRTLPWKTSKR